MPNVPGCLPCPETCPSVFDRVVVSYLVAGGTRVLWQLLPTFTVPGPYVFQLQVGTSPNPYADDWTDVGLPVTDQYTATDGQQRVWGKTNWTHYRVVLTAGGQSYESTPVHGMGALSVRDWRLAREIARKERLKFRLDSQDGFLLKRRITGVRCRNCTDFQTNEIRQPDCPVCLGTGYECGYYYPLGCVWAAFRPGQKHMELDGDKGGQRGTIDDRVYTARMLLVDLLGEEDVWVNATSDERYFVHKITVTGEWRGVPIVGDVELRPVAYSSHIYSLAIPEQLALPLPV